jgi:hypothetical protein
MTTIDPSYSQEHTNGAHDTVAPEPIDLVAGAADLETRATSVLKELHAAIEASKARTARLVSVLAHMIGVPGAAELSTVLARAPAPPKRVRKPAKAKAATKAPKAAKAVRKGKSKPAVGTLGAKVLEAMGLDDYTGHAPFITRALGLTPAAVQGQLNNLLARGFVTSKGERAARVWGLA